MLEHLDESLPPENHLFYNWMMPKITPIAEGVELKEYSDGLSVDIYEGGPTHSYLPSGEVISE